MNISPFNVTAQVKWSSIFSGMKKSSASLMSSPVMPVVTKRGVWVIIDPIGSWFNTKTLLWSKNIEYSPFFVKTVGWIYCCWFLNVLKSNTRLQHWCSPIIKKLILEVEMIKFLFFRFYNIYWSSLLSNRSDIVLHKDNWLRKRI